jgi:O-antigen/teichoic acid export membrane protein
MAFSFRNILLKVGIDTAILYTIFSRLIQAGSGLISLLFITRYLTSDEQGYYYTFSSLIAVQIFFELGLSGIITQYAAHEFAHLKWTDKGELEGDDYYKSRLSSLLRFCVKWFFVISIILLVVLLITGFHFFSTFNSKLNIQWQSPWVVLCFATVLNLYIDPLLAYFDGLGKVEDMAKMRLYQRVFNIALLFIFFASGFKLYSAPLASLGSILLNYFQIAFSNRIRLLKIIWKAQAQWSINYMKEIFPFQWKIAVSWIGGYFIFQLFNPVLFASEGPVVAGQMGMTLQILNGVIAISISWISTKIPLFSQLIAKKEYEELDLIFNRTLKSLIGLSFLMLLVFNLGVYIIHYAGFGLSKRFLPILPTILLSVACLLNQFVTAWATYLRCHKKEPLLLQTIIISILCCLSIIILGKKFGLLGIVSGYTFIIAVISPISTYFIFKSKKHEWHA